MDDPLQANRKAVFEFSRIVQDHLQTGCDVFGNEKKYVRYNTLLEYWERHKILEALKMLSPDSTASVETIKDAYIRVFSMLVYTDRLYCLQDAFLSANLHDDLLPSPSPSPQWPPAPVYHELFKVIQPEQWLFHPLCFHKDYLNRRRLEPDHVLPIVKREQLAAGNDESASVYRIMIDDHYNKLVDSDTDGTPLQRTFVLKTYDEEQAELYWNEVKAYTTLATRSENIINYYGSFIQSGKHSLILEYADGDSLDSLFKNTSPPRDPEDIQDFWASYFGFFKGAYAIHQAGDNNYGLHGDIKPGNMLRMRRNLTNSQYSFTAKFADFGYSHFRSVGPNGEDMKAVDFHGNKEYSAPEASHHTEVLCHSPNRIDHSADIFSLGCVTSNVIVWMALGEIGQKDYFEDRKAAAKRLTSFVGSGYEGCFHNGVERLPEVDVWHRAALDALPNTDTLTPRIAKLVETAMLLGKAKERWDARRIARQFDVDYAEAKSPPLEPESIASPLTPLSPHLFDSTRPPSTQTIATTSTVDGVHSAYRKPECHRDTRPSLPLRPNPYPSAGPSYHKVQHALPTIIRPKNHEEEQVHEPSPTGSLVVPGTSADETRRSFSSSIYRPTLSINELRDYHQAKKGKRNTDLGVTDTIENALKRYVKGRDHLFLIDNSEPMANYKPAVEDAFRLLSYVAKMMDKDGIELGFLSDFPKKKPIVFNKKRTSKLGDILREKSFDRQPDMMEDHFAQCVDKYILPRIKTSSKPLSIFIFTDGVWGSSGEGAAGVERPVKRIMECMVTWRIPRTRLMISFVRFGNSAIGKQYLDYLDDCGKAEEFYGGGRRQSCDIVDTGHISGNIYKLFIGSITQHNDDVPD